MEALDTLAPANTEARPGYKHTPLGWVPVEWEVVRVNDVARMGTGHTPSKKHPHYYGGDIKWVSLQDTHRLNQFYITDTTIQITDEGLRNCSAVLLPANTVILMRTVSIGKVAILSESMAVCQNYVTWTCGSELLPAFLYFTLQHNKTLFESQGGGSAVKTIGLPFFEKLQITLPPLPEQQRIVAVLTAVDETLTAYDNLLHAKRRYKQGLMQLLLTGQRRFPEFAGQAWREARLSQFLTESRLPGSTGDTARKLTVRLYGKGVFAKQERGGSINTKYFTRRAGQLIYSKLDFLNGAFGLIPEHLDGYESTLDLPAFNVSPDADPDFLLAYLGRPEFYGLFTDVAAGGRKAVRIAPEKLLKKQLLLPSLPEQRRIAAVLTTLSTELHLLAAQRAHWQQQKQGLLRALLMGTVRVKIT